MDGLDLVPRVTCAQRSEWTEPSGAPSTTARDPAGRSRSTSSRTTSDQGEHPPPAPRYRLSRDVVPRTRPRARRWRSARRVLPVERPGDPAAVTYGVAAVKELCASAAGVRHLPRAQISPRARRADTQAAVRSPRREPPRARQTTGRSRSPSQNHGFIVDASTLPSASCHAREPVRSLQRGHRRRREADLQRQYHPEASPGPHDSSYLFARFRTCSRRGGDVREVAGRAARSGDRGAVRATHRRCRGRLAGAPRVRGAPRQGPSEDELWEP